MQKIKCFICDKETENIGSVIVIPPESDDDSNGEVRYLCKECHQVINDMILNQKNG